MLPHPNTFWNDELDDLLLRSARLRWETQQARARAQETREVCRERVKESKRLNQTRDRPVERVA